MSFDCITEGSKDYIKYVLQLNEESMTGVTFVAPGVKEKSSFKFSGGAGGKGLGCGDKVKPGQFIKKNKKEDGDKLRGQIMFGGSAVPGVVVGKSKKGKTKYSTQGGLDYLTSLSQAQSAIEFANQMMPAALKLALSASLFGTSVGEKGKPVLAPGETSSSGSPSGAEETAPTDSQPGKSKNKKEEEKNRKEASNSSLKDQISNLTGPEGEFAKQFAQMGGDVIGRIENMTGAEGIAKASPLAAKVMKATKNLGALDPFNPLLGLQLGVEMLGGKEVLRRTRELGAVQSAGAASSMGHPSGFRGY